MAEAAPDDCQGGGMGCLSVFSSSRVKVGFATGYDRICLLSKAPCGGYRAEWESFSWGVRSRSCEFGVEKMEIWGFTR